MQESSKDSASHLLAVSAMSPLSLSAPVLTGGCEEKLNKSCKRVSGPGKSAPRHQSLHIFSVLQLPGLVPAPQPLRKS